MFTFRTLVLTVCLLTAAGIAHAHAHLSRSTPADGSTVSAAPANVVLTFSEPARLTVAWVQRGDEPKQKLGPLPDKTAGEVTLAIPKLTPGSYVVSWRAVGGDGHVVPGQIRFTVAPGKAAAAG